MPLGGEGGAALAFARAEEIFVALDESEAEADREFMAVRARAVLWHPVVRDRAAIGVLAIAWRTEVAGVPLRISTMIDLLGAEAAVAIGRADLLGQLEHLARTDGLTGLPNRRHWEQQLPRELARAWRDGRQLCVAMLDLDYFKDYNDRHGHQAGDRLLSEAAIAWRAALRPYDILARYGGEEFSVILPGCDVDDARQPGRAAAGLHPAGRVVLGRDRRVGRRGAPGDPGRPCRRGPLPGQAGRAQPVDRRQQHLTVPSRTSAHRLRATRAPAPAMVGRCQLQRCARSPVCWRRRGAPRAPALRTRRGDLRRVHRARWRAHPPGGAAVAGSVGSSGRRRTRGSPASSSRRSSSARGSGWRRSSRPRSPMPAGTPRPGVELVAVPRPLLACAGAASTRRS